MNSTRVMIGLIVAYAIIMTLAGCEGKWYRALYYLGAIIISLAVMGMTEE